MLVGYEANNVLRNSHELGEFGRQLVSRIAEKYTRDYRALLFATRISDDFHDYFTSFSNVSTFIPYGFSRALPQLWMRYRLNPWLQEEKVKVFHGLNEELPYYIGRDVKTIITCYGVSNHHNTSLIDGVLWKKRMKYAFKASDVIVTVSEKAKQQLLSIGVSEKKIVIIGGSHPYEVNDEIIDQYFRLYQRLLVEK